MSMKISKLTTYWDAAEAHSIITLLDELRDTIWDTYGPDIIELCHEEHMQERKRNRQREMENRESDEDPF